MLFNERVAIMEEIKFIREERVRLGDRYWQLISRLRELDNQEKEAVDIYNLTDKLIDTINTLSKLVPNITVDQLITSFKDENPNIEEVIEENTYSKKEKLIINSVDINIEKETEETQSNIKRRKYNDLKKISSVVASVLKENGRPMLLREIVSALDEKDINLGKAPTTAMMHIMNHDNRIQKVMRGCYQLI